MPLLIGPFAGMVLLALAGAPEPVARESPEAAGTPAAPVAPPDAWRGDRGLAIGVLALHALWGGLAGAWLWRRRRTLLRPAADPETPAPSGIGGALLAGALFVWFGTILGAGSAQLLLRIGPEEMATLRGMVLVNAGGYLGGLLALAFLSAMFWPLGAALGTRPVLADVPRALGAYLLAHPFVWLIGWASTWLAQALAGSRPLDPLAHDTLRALAQEPKGTWWVLAVVIAVVAAPVLEEIIYRGLVQNGLARLIRSPALAIGGASLLFALVHAPSVATHALPTLFALGVAFGIAYHRTRSLALCIVMHAAFNALNLSLAILAL